MKGTGPNLIEKILFKTIFLLNGGFMQIIQPKYFQVKWICCQIHLFEKINKYKLKLKSKSQITLGLQKSISVKNRLYTNFINKKNPLLKGEFYTNYKKCTNLLFTLMKKSKQAYCDKYFERNSYCGLWYQPPFKNTPSC